MVLPRKSKAKKGDAGRGAEYPAEYAQGDHPAAEAVVEGEGPRHHGRGEGVQREGRAPHGLGEQALRRAEAQACCGEGGGGGIQEVSGEGVVRAAALSACAAFGSAAAADSG